MDSRSTFTPCGLRRRLPRLVAIALAWAWPSIASAQATGAAPLRPPSPMTPSPAHEALEFFAGSWTLKELPAARQFRETCGWLEGGRRHMVCRSRSLTASGEWRDGISMFSYRSADSTYLYYGLRPNGATETLTGRRLGTAQSPGWQFDGGGGQGATRVRTRVTITKEGGGTFRLLEQMAEGDGAWNAGDAVTYVPAPKTQ